MDYEKKYKEALGWMQSLYNGLHGKTKEEAERYFPELKDEDENADEKVRKALIKLVTNHASMDLFIEYDIHLDEALSWLEKQGQVKESIISQHENKICKESNDSLTSEDEKIKKSLAAYFTKFKPDDMWDADFSFGDIVAWFEKQGKKSAWSEEDENRINRLIAYFEDKESFTAEDDVVYAYWLKSLKDKPKQEWSEEDENHVKSILSTIECCKAQFPNAQAVVEAYNADIEWLKSLRPQSQWKPSGLPHWQKSNLPNNNTTGFNSDYFCYKGYCINYKELFEKLPKDD